MSKVSKKQWVIKKSLFEFLVKVLFTLMYLPSSVETLVSFCMTGLCALVLGISSLLSRRKKGRGRGREKSTKSPSLFPFLPIPYPFRRLLRRLGISCFVNIVDRTFACQPSHSAVMIVMSRATCDPLRAFASICLESQRKCLSMNLLHLVLITATVFCMGCPATSFTNCREFWTPQPG